MKIKSGKELSQLALIKRLNLMGVKYDSSIMGKNYYIDLYDKEILSPLNQAKIKADLERDNKYDNYLCQKLQKRSACSFQLCNNYIKNIEPNSNKSNYFEDFNKVFFHNVVGAKLGIDTFEYFVNNKNSFNYVNDKIIFPFKAISKCTYFKINSFISETMKSIINYVDSLKLEQYDYIKYILFFVFILVIIMIMRFFFKKFICHKNGINISIKNN